MRFGVEAGVPISRGAGPVLQQNSPIEHIEVDALRIAYTRTGSGPSLVMVHGAPADSRTWQWMVADLAADHTVVAWDAPGFGQSSDIDDTWRAAQFADALAAFIGTLGLQRPHVVGHSFGTMVALSLFGRHALVPETLVLIGGYAGWAGSLPPEEATRRLDMFLGMADEGDAFDPKSHPGLFTDLIPVDRDAELVTMVRENIRPASIRAAGYTSSRPPTSPGASSVISTSQLTVLPKLGHACVVENPEACATTA